MSDEDTVLLFQALSDIVDVLEDIRDAVQQLANETPAADAIDELTRLLKKEKS